MKEMAIDNQTPIQLRPFAKSDIKQLINWVDSPEFLLQWAGRGFSYPLDEAQLTSLIKKTSEGDPSLLAFTPVISKTGEALGHVQLSSINRTDRSAAIARVLVGPKILRNRGLGRKIMEAVLQVGFEKLSLHRIYLNVFDFNHNAIACYEHLGFQREGLLRDTVRVGNKYWSHFIMSILEEEWRVLNKKTVST